MIHRRPRELESRQVDVGHRCLPVLVSGSAAAGITGHSRRAGVRRHHPDRVIAIPRPGTARNRTVFTIFSNIATAISPFPGMRAARPAGDSETVNEHYDVIIIGSGAGGGTLAHALAGSGKSILLLERGGFLPREMGQLEYRGRCSWTGSTSPKTPGSTGTASRSSRRCIISWAGRPRCTARRCTGCARPTSARSGMWIGISPAWPLGYGDFEPWYSQAEQLYQVHGNGGEDPTEGPRSKPYPWPAVAHEPRIQQISDGLAKGGWHPFHAPCGILLNEAEPAMSTCIRCATCDGYPCLVHAKSDAEVIAVRPLLGKDNVTLVTGAEVTRLETDPSGRTVTGVVVERDGDREIYSGDIVAVSAGAANSAKLLLNSASDTRPNGLADGSDQVEHRRDYMATTARPWSRWRRRRTTRSSRRRWGSTLLLPDQGLPVAGRQHPDDRQVQRRGHARRKAHPDQAVPGVDPVRRGQARGHFWLTTEDLPTPGNASPPIPAATSIWPTPRPTTTRPSASTASCARS